jgi:beta-D-galactosyl-(1->4)-L-rhamnose phosphorylase
VGDLTTVPVKEIRFHPYFFPVEVGGKPTFSEGGEPRSDLELYWRDVRRACLRTRINRIGFGGIISLLDGYDEFVEYVGEVSRQSRRITACHLEGPVWRAPIQVGVLNEWGELRSWMYNGHMRHNSIYNQLLESLSGLPLDVRFLSFDEVLEHGVPNDLDVLVNCGREGTAWSGGERWLDTRLQTELFRFVHDGGGFIGIGEPSACAHGGRFFQLAPMLGVDRDVLLTQQNVKYENAIRNNHFIMADGGEPLDLLDDVSDLTLCSPHAEVIACRKLSECEHFYDILRPQLITHRFGQGRSVYFSGFKYTPLNTRALSRALYWAAGKESRWGEWQSDNPYLECAWFPETGKLLVVNNDTSLQQGVVSDGNGGTHSVTLSKLEMCELSLRHDLESPRAQLSGSFTPNLI